MAIINRDLDASQQVKDVHVNTALAATTDHVMLVVNTLCELESIKVASDSVSGAVTLQAEVDRFNGATVDTVVISTSTDTLPDYAASGSILIKDKLDTTKTKLYPGDILIVRNTGAGTATLASFAVALRNTTDFVSRV